MAKKITLFNFVKGKKTQAEPEKKFLDFIRGEEKGKILFLRVGPEAKCAKDFEVTAISEDYDEVKEARERNANINYLYTDFSTFAKKKKRDEFDIITDIYFCNTVKVNYLNKYFRKLSKLLRYRGKLYIQALSTDDIICKEHCPNRKWTKIKGNYLYFYDKFRLKRLVEQNQLKILHYEHSCDGRSYHIIHAEQTVKKW